MTTFQDQLYQLGGAPCGPIITGNVFWVDSGSGLDSAGSGYGTSAAKPFATLDYAVGQCTANHGDVIYLLPGHAETITADSGVDIDVAGVTVIGLGNGAARPTFTFTTAVTADFKLAAASVRVENVLFLGGIDATTGVVEISAADCALVDCEYRDSTGQATDAITILTDADRVLIDGLTYIGDSAAGTNAAIAVVAADDLTIRNFNIYGNFAVSAIDFRTTASNRCNIHDGKIWTENAADICIKDTVTASTGHIGPNLYLMLQDNAANITEAITGATFQQFDNIYVCNLAGEKAMLINTTASTDA